MLMGDNMHQPRDENGQFVSLNTLFERERLDHQQEHVAEHVVAAETARRLETKVIEAAVRLERDVQTALVAVADTARIHSEAHNREHGAHERIHQVEKEQVESARKTMEKRLDGMNEFRQALTDQANRAVSREYYDQRHEDLKQKVVDADTTLAAKINDLEKRSASSEAVDAYKKVVYSAVVVGVISLFIALFNLITKT